MKKVEFVNSTLKIEHNQNGTSSAVAATGYGYIGMTFDRSATEHILQQIDASNDKMKIRNLTVVSIILEGKIK